MAEPERKDTERPCEYHRTTQLHTDFPRHTVSEDTNHSMPFTSESSFKDSLPGWIWGVVSEKCSVLHTKSSQSSHLAWLDTRWRKSRTKKPQTPINDVTWLLLHVFASIQLVNRLSSNKECFHHNQYVPGLSICCTATNSLVSGAKWWASESTAYSR